MLAVIGPIGFVYQTGKRRRRVDLQRVAASMGFSVVPDLDRLPDTAFLALPVFREHFFSSLDEVVRRSGDEVILCRHYSSQGVEGSYQYQTIACFRATRGGPLPDFVLRPQTLWGVLAATWGQDLQFESHPSFATTYRLRGPDEDAIRTLFAPPVLDELLQDVRWCVESGYGWMIVYRSADDVAIRELPRFLQQTTRIIRLLSRFERL